MPSSDWFGGGTDLSHLPNAVLESILYGSSISDSDVRQPPSHAVNDAFLEELLSQYRYRQRDDSMFAIDAGRELFGGGARSEVGDPSEWLGKLLFQPAPMPTPQSPLIRALLGQL